MCRVFLILTTILLCCVASQAALTFIPTPPNAGSMENYVVTKLGSILGVIGNNSVNYLGVPFATPPVGNLRFSAPTPHTGWNQTLLANTYQPGCLQTCELPPQTCPPQISEDCLYADLYVPRATSNKNPRAVMIFLPGGRFEQGANATPLYGGETIANTSNTIVMVINYRLGGLGFLVTPEFPSGNYGFLDQRMAMQWIQQNIKAFNGDPNRVTLFGQSAGATSTTAHIIAPPSWPLFQQAIIESNPAALALNNKTVAEKISRAFATGCGCTFFLDSKKQRQCLLSATPAQLIKGQTYSNDDINPENPIQAFYPWTPTVDGNDVPSDIWTAFSTGKFHKVPTLQGTVRDEALMFIYGVFTKPTNNFDYYATFDAVFHKNAHDILSMYPAPPPHTNDTRPYMNMPGTDYVFSCPTRKVANYTTQYAPTYLYQYDHVASFSKGMWGPNYAFCDNSVCHGSELPFVFNAASRGGFQWGPGEYQLSMQMNYYWSNFANTGNPNVGPNPVNVNWPLFQSSTLKNIQFNTTIFINQNLKGSNCDYFDSIGYNQP